MCACVCACFQGWAGASQSWFTPAAVTRPYLACCMTDNNFTAASASDEQWLKLFIWGKSPLTERRGPAIFTSGPIHLVSLVGWITVFVFVHYIWVTIIPLTSELGPSCCKSQSHLNKLRLSWRDFFFFYSQRSLLCLCAADVWRVILSSVNFFSKCCLWHHVTAEKMTSWMPGCPLNRAGSSL